MKKVILMLVAGAFISLTTMSCNKCGSCNGAGSAICEKNSQTAYDLAKENCEAAGGNWELE